MRAQRPLMQSHPFLGLCNHRYGSCPREQLRYISTHRAVPSFQRTTAAMMNASSRPAFLLTPSLAYSRRLVIKLAIVGITNVVANIAPLEALPYNMIG